MGRNFCFILIYIYFLFHTYIYQLKIRWLHKNTLDRLDPFNRNIVGAVFFPVKAFWNQLVIRFYPLSRSFTHCVRIRFYGSRIYSPSHLFRECPSPYTPWPSTEFPNSSPTTYLSANSDADRLVAGRLSPLAVYTYNQSSDFVALEK